MPAKQTGALGAALDRLRRTPRDTGASPAPVGPETREQAAARVTDRSPATQQATVQQPALEQSVAQQGAGSGLRRPASQPRKDGSSEAAEQPRGALPRMVVIAVALAAVLLALSELRQVKDLVAPVFFALNLMITAYPVQRFLVRHGAPSWLGSIAAGLAVLLVLGLMLFGLSYCVAAMVGEMPTYTSQFTNLYNESLAMMGRLGFDQTVLLRALKGIDPNSVVSVVTGVLSNASGVASLAVVVLTTLIFTVMDSMQVEQRLDVVRRSHPHVVDALQSFARGIRKYWLVSTAFGIIVAVVDYGVLVGVGVPLALVWAMFSFLTNYIPNIGFVVGLVPPALLALVNGGWKDALVVVVAYCVVNFIIQSIIQPRVAGDAVGLTPTLSFISLLLWGWVFGGLGALLALPFSLLVKALLVDIDPRVRWVNGLISSRIDDAETPPAQQGGPAA